ncbi:MAG TPA: outer membrane beta-barrel family protein [Daejeonella sp.]|nr:outer membrane beta-barrel family protein [Daejeonella sp.]
MRNIFLFDLKKIILLTLIFFSITVLAQEKVIHKGISGFVVNEAKLAMEAATVMLLSQADSSLVKMEICDQKGAFNFQNIPSGNYLISISAIGYQKLWLGPYQISSTKPVIKLGELKLNPVSANLKEVDIVDTRRYVEVKPGKIMLNVDNSILAAGSTAYDLLKKAPGLQMDHEDNLKLNGKTGVLVMLNGKQTFMEPEALMDMLKGMQSNDIEQVELISNPSAKYVAAGTGAIINIKTKKNKNFGTNGSLTGMGGVSKLGSIYNPNGRFNTGLNLNHRNKSYNIYGNYTYADISVSRNSLLGRKINYGNQSSAIDVDYYGLTRRQAHTYKLGADYQINSKNIIGLLFSGSDILIGIDKYSSSSIYNQGQLDTTILTDSYQNRKLLNNIFNLNYKGSLAKNSGEISIDLDYINYDRSSLELLNQFMHFNSDSYAYRPSLLLKNSSPSKYSIYSLKADYSLPLNKKTTLEMGLQASQVKGNSRLDFGQLIGSDFLPDARFSNQFKIDERIAAVYLNYNLELKNASLVLGLRTEHTNSEGFSVTNNDLNRRKYFDFFPNIQYSQNLDKDNQLMISFGRRIGRPGYDNLNTFVAYLDQYSFRSGNPLLKPAYTQNLELTHVYQDKYSSTFRVSKTTDIFMEINEQDDLTKVNTAIMRNLDRQYAYGLEFNVPIEPTAWWNVDLNLEAMYEQYKNLSGTGKFNNSSPNVVLTTSNSFKLPGKFNAELSGKYESAVAYGIYDFDPVYTVNAGFSKSVFNRKALLRLSISDILNSQQNRYRSTYQNLNLFNSEKRETRAAWLSFSYQFGKKTVKSARKRSTGSESEQSRMGN